MIKKYDKPSFFYKQPWWWPIARYAAPLQSRSWRDAMKIDENRALVGAVIVWIITWGLALYGFLHLFGAVR